MYSAPTPPSVATCSHLQHSQEFRCHSVSSRDPVKALKWGTRNGRLRMQAASPSKSDVGSLKQQISDRAGTKNGTDRSSSEAADIAQLLQQLEESGTLEDLDLAGTEWRLLYTESKGSSSGKIAIGPFKFVGRVAQVFPKEQPGQYINKVDFGLLQADLLANYKQTAKDRILVSFEYIEFKLGPLRFKQDISNGRPDTSGGYWRLAYTDERFRVLYTNLGNVFILVR